MIFTFKTLCTLLPKLRNPAYIDICIRLKAWDQVYIVLKVLLVWL